MKQVIVAGVDGCPTGWIAFKVDACLGTTSAELVDLPAVLKSRPPGLACIAIDIPIGLPHASRACDKEARKLLGRPRGSSVFPAPCRASLAAANHADANTANRQITGRGLSQQAWGIVPKIRQVDDATTPECQRWAFEVHPEVCFWALAGGRAMAHRKKTPAGVNERLDLLRNVFPHINNHLISRPSGVGKDDLLDAAVAAWTALRAYRGELHGYVSLKQMGRDWSAPYGTSDERIKTAGGSEVQA